MSRNLLVLCALFKCLLYALLANGNLLIGQQYALHKIEYGMVCIGTPETHVVVAAVSKVRRANVVENTITC